jgi:hypothetical protein
MVHVWCLWGLIKKESFTTETQTRSYARRACIGSVLLKEGIRRLVLWCHMSLIMR